MPQMYLAGIWLEDDLPPGPFDSFRLFCVGGLWFASAPGPKSNDVVSEFRDGLAPRHMQYAD